jgi:pyruvate/oxaloacetate carboxyltransferase
LNQERFIKYAVYVIKQLSAYVDNSILSKITPVYLAAIYGNHSHKDLQFEIDLLNLKLPVNSKAFSAALLMAHQRATKYGH